MNRVQDNQDGGHLVLVAVPASPALRHMPLSLHRSQGRHLTKNIARNLQSSKRKSCQGRHLTNKDGYKIAKEMAVKDAIQPKTKNVERIENEREVKKAIENV